MLHLSLDSTAKRHLISNAVNLIRVTKGRNIIVSSQALNAMETRGPYDVTNLYVIRTQDNVVMPESNNTLDAHCLALILHRLNNLYLPIAVLLLFMQVCKFIIT